ncbi:MAG TPA: 4-hydroxy-tetrahydrodipicolinate synthase [Burkholderiaceae bacterium]
MSPFEGIWIPIVTPFRNGGVDLGAAQRLAVEFIDSGVHGLVVCGTTGEAATLDENEQTAMLSAVREAAGSRCPVVMGIAGNDTRAVAEKVTRYNQYEAAGYLISAPYYVRPSQQGMLLHFQTISAATDTPIILYNIPARTGVNIELDTIAMLALDPNFVAIKQCGSSIAPITELINRTSLRVLCGDDTLIYAALCNGGHGAISAAAHIRPDLFVQIYNHIKAGNLEQACAIFYALLPLIRQLFSEPNPAPLKAALALQGKIKEELRLPMVPISSTCKMKLASILEQAMALPVRPMLLEINHAERIAIQRPPVLQSTFTLGVSRIGQERT